MCGELRLGEPLLCRLGFHKWQNSGSQVMVSWKEPHALRARLEGEFVTYSKAVYEGKQCKRCGMKLRRKLVANSDGTVSCVGWEPDTKETEKE